MAAFRALTPQARVRMAAEMSDEVRQVAIAGIRDRHPRAGDEEVRSMLSAMMLGLGTGGIRRTSR
jgi:hypothetical protein